MSCFGEDSIKVSNMAAPLKSGYMLKYKKRLFCKDWKEHYVTLYNDSTLVWYKDRHSNEKEGGVYIKNSPDLMAFGEYTKQVPNRPELPSGYTISTLIVFGTRGKETVHWFLCKYELEVKEWISAIVSTLPSPPLPPQPATNPSAPVVDDQQQKPVSELPPASTNPPVLPPYQAAMPGQYPPQNMIPLQQSPYPQQIGPLQPGYPMRQAPNNTTVVVQDRQNNSGSDFAMGMLMGGAMGYTWGHGFGWGHGGGWGGGWGGGGVHQDTDIHIHNNYDINNHIQNTSNVQSETTNVFDNDVPDSFDVDDDFGGDFDGGGFDGGDF